MSSAPANSNLLNSGQGYIGEALAKHLELFGQLLPEDRAALVEVEGELRQLDRGEDVVRIGDKPTHVVIVLRGLLQRYTIDEEGSRQIHSFYVPTETPSLEALYMDALDNALSPVTPSIVGLISHADIMPLIEQRPKLMALIWRETLIQASIFREALMRNSHKLAHARMANFFCEMMVRSKAAGLADGDSCPLPITQDELADALGMSPVHINRTLMVLRSTGWMEFKSGVLIIYDFERLAELAGFDPAYLHLRQSV